MRINCLKSNGAIARNWLPWPRQTKCRQSGVAEQVQPTTARRAPPPFQPLQPASKDLTATDWLLGITWSMSVFKIEGYEAQVQVLSDGTINLPRLGTVDVWGLTLEEARQRITAGYSRSCGNRWSIWIL